MLSLQEIFDKSVKGLMAQGVKSTEINDSDACMYRSEDGKKCAIGFLIDDVVYQPQMERLGVSNLFAKFGNSMTAIGLDESEHGTLLNALQAVHDTRHVDHWRGFFATIAERFGLNTEVIDNAK